MRLRVLKVGCFGGGTGLPSLLGGLRNNPWIDLHAVVTMFDSGGSSGQLRDELGVLPPGDVLKCALALARNEREARKILLARLPMLTGGRLAGHTGGNLLLSMMEQYTGGDFLAAVDGLRALARLPRPRLADHRPALDALRGVHRRIGDARGSGSGRRPGRRPPHPPALARSAGGDSSVGGRRDPVDSTRSSSVRAAFFTSLLPIFLVDGCREALAEMRGPVDLYRESAHGRPRHGGIHRRACHARGCRKPSAVRSTSSSSTASRRRRRDVLDRYASEHKAPLPLGDTAGGCQLIEGAFWRSQIARHDRSRLRSAVWTALADRLLLEQKEVVSRG